MVEKNQVETDPNKVSQYVLICTWHAGPGWGFPSVS